VGRRSCRPRKVQQGTPKTNFGRQWPRSSAAWAGDGRRPAARPSRWRLAQGVEGDKRPAMRGYANTLTAPPDAGPWLRRGQRPSRARPALSASTQFRPASNRNRPRTAQQPPGDSRPGVMVGCRVWAHQHCAEGISRFPGDQPRRNFEPGPMVGAKRADARGVEKFDGPPQAPNARARGPAPGLFHSGARRPAG